MVHKNAIENTFSFQIVTTSTPQTFTLPLGSSASYNQDFTIDWGDGSSSTITSYDDVDKAHSYAAPGTYNLEIIGTCEYFGFNDSGSKALLKKLTGLRGDIGLLYVNFYGCTNLNYIDSTMNLWYKITSFEECFRKCELTSIPSGLFDNCPLVTTFEGCFKDCWILTTIPSGLFDNNPLVTNFEDCFAICSILTNIPSGLFDNNTLVTTFEGCFRHSDVLTSIPSGLFDNNPLVTIFGGCFFNCHSLTSIPSGLFDNNPLVTSFEACFYSNDMTSIPSGLFDNNPLVTNFEACFWYCWYITSIPSGLFDNNPLVTTFEACFKDCTGINTDLPTNLILYNTEIDNVIDMFYGCLGMTGLGVPFVTTAESHGVSSYTDCFQSCTSLTDYASIPAGWK